MINPVFLYRIYSALWRIGIPRVPGCLQRLNLFITGCDLPASAIVGRNVRLQHFGRGIIISHKCRIEDDVMIMPNVVIGVSANAMKVCDLSCIHIKAGALIGAGAVILAKDRLTVGRGATVGALALVTRDVADHDTVVGVPARSILHISRGEVL